MDARGVARTVVQERQALSGEAFTLRSGFLADDWQIHTSTVDNLQAVRLRVVAPAARAAALEFGDVQPVHLAD